METLSVHFWATTASHLNGLDEANLGRSSNFCYGAEAGIMNTNGLIAITPVANIKTSVR